MPRLNGRRRTCAPRSAAIPAVRSVEPSSTTTMSKPGSNAWISSITRPTVSSSLSAGTIAMRRSSPISTGPSCAGAPARARAQPPAATGVCRPTSSRICRARCAYVCSSSTRSRARRPISSACAGIVEQLAIGSRRLVCIRDDEQLRPASNQRSMPFVRIGDDRRAGGCELERPAGRRRVDVACERRVMLRLILRARDRAEERR